MAGNIALQDIMRFESLFDFKIHFAKWDGEEPLDVYMRDFDEWKGWNTYSGGKNNFNRKYIFSLINFYPERDTWLFGGIWEVIETDFDKIKTYPYKIQLADTYTPFIGRLKISYPYKERSVRVNMEKHFDKMIVKEVLQEPYSCVTFPGYKNVDYPFRTIETVIKTDNPAWKNALCINGIYLITDVKSGKRYVGSASGEQGIWGRWSNYVYDGHGGDVDLKTLVNKKGFEYVKDAYKFTILEILNAWDDVYERENYWKRALLTRQAEFGHNKN